MKNNRLLAILLGTAVAAGGMYHCSSNSESEQKPLEEKVEKSDEPEIKGNGSNYTDDSPSNEPDKLATRRNEEARRAAREFRKKYIEYLKKRGIFRDPIPEKNTKYVPLKDRTFATGDEAEKLLFKNLKKQDYKLVAADIKNVLEHYHPKDGYHPSVQGKLKEIYLSAIVDDYKIYLSDIDEATKNCGKYDTSSINRKISYMNVFFFTNDKFFPDEDNEERRIEYKNKSDKILKAMERCKYL